MSEREIRVAFGQIFALLGDPIPQLFSTVVKFVAIAIGGWDAGTAKGVFCMYMEGSTLQGGKDSACCECTY